MPNNLVIVESPAKAKTIEGFLGKDFVVKSCYGHIRDLPKDDSAIDVKNGFQPHYIVSPDKKDVIKSLTDLAKTAQTVWLASDEDREGEAISWHLYETLKLSPSKTKRIVFHEITKKAIEKAIQQPRDIDINLVNAQQARRVLDRLVGFELSPVLWKKVKPSLSAGRVQSVAVRLLVEREREIQAFESSSSFQIEARLFTDAEGKESFVAKLPRRPENAAQAEEFLRKAIGAIFTVGDVEVKPARKSPAAPFTTSTLQQEASRKLGFSITKTMTLAQSLYEHGFITYMRTDSVNLSEEALAAANQAVKEQYGVQYARRRTYTTKTAGAQEAHEAIRPTDFTRPTAGNDNDERRLYELIWKRGIASQMSDAELERTTADILLSTTDEHLVASGEVLKFDGFLKVYLESHDDEGERDDEAKLPPLVSGQKLFFESMTAAEKFSKPAPRYTEASLVKRLEELGIGRPSTYAPTIATIQKRNYAVKETREGRERVSTVLTLSKAGAISQRQKKETFGAEKNKLFPTDIGMVVTDFLTNYFPEILDYNFTASVEKEFDDIAQGQQEWKQMLSRFYQPFHTSVENAMGVAEKVSGERILGTHPETGQQVLVRMGRYGAIAQIGNGEDKLFASLRKEQSIETITLPEALDLFRLPRVVGQFEGKEMKAAIGRFGPYIAHASKFYSLAKTDDPYTINEQRAIELITAKRQADAEKVITAFPEREDVRVLNGRWGPYIAVGKNNVKIPKGEDPRALTLERCLQLAAESGVAEPKTTAKKITKAASGTTTKPATRTKSTASGAKKAASRAGKSTTKKSKD